ncbi:hypothetical protein GSY74_07120, partial [Sulfurovum sp. bin170]|uniref:hypothetical protein n=1 Tax=Sulfurovum sp. bin170 TaxID=2695268 RepID=UPI001417BAAE
RLTLDNIKENIIDLEKIENFEKEIQHPAQQLDEIYFLVKRHWSKKEKSVLKTINSLDYENLYFDVKDKIPSLNHLITEIDNFFSE